MHRTKRSADMVWDLTASVMAGALVVEKTPTTLPGYAVETLSDSVVAALAAPGLPPLGGLLRTLAQPLQWSPTHRLYLPPHDGIRLVLPARTPTAGVYPAASMAGHGGRTEEETPRKP